MTSGNPWLAAGGVLSAIAGAAHLGCIIGGAAWYRFFGAGERMARMVERGRIEPTLITLTIATILFVWAAYGLSGGGVIQRLPLLRPALVAISAIYLVRTAALPVMLRTMADRGAIFLWVSSAIVLVFGLAYAIGTVAGWEQLA